MDCGSRFNESGTDYFRTFGVALRAGREFTEADQLGAQRVAIVNEAFARKFNLGADVVGTFMGEGGPPVPGDGGASDSLNVQIVGLVPNVKYSDVKDSVPPVYYRPWRQDPNIGAMYFYVRSAVAPEQMLGTLRTVIKRIDPNLPVEE